MPYVPHGQQTIDRAALLRTGARLTAVALASGALLDPPAVRGVLAARSAGAPLTVDAWISNHAAPSMASLRAHATQLTRLNPSWYVLEKDLTITSSALASVIDLAREQGVALYPLIRNAGFDPAIMGDALQSRARRSMLAARIAAVVTRHDFDGINLDFEGPFGAYRAEYADFVHRIAALLHREGKRVTVDVATQLKPVSQLPAGSWSAPYDYAALASAADAMILMAYNHSSRRPGSLAPLWWVRDAVKAALAQAPAGKLVVGMAFYGRHWLVKGTDVSHTDLTQAQAEALLASSGAAVQRPVADATPRFTWRDAEGTHIVHYEDGQSLAAKLNMALTMGAAGVAFWRLGLEEPSQWDVIAAAVRARG